MSLYFADWIVHATNAELLAQRFRLQDERRTCRTAEARKILGAVIRCINEEIDRRVASPLRRAAGHPRRQAYTLIFCRDKYSICLLFHTF